jgi:hypothetical protein
MALVHRFGQRIGDPSTHAYHGRFLDAELHGDCVGCPKSNAADVARQPVGVLTHDLEGIGAIGLVDPHRSCRADPMAVQKDHDLAHDLLLGPGCADPEGAERADALDFAQAIRLCFDDVKNLLAECLDHLLRIDRANAANHSRGKIFLNAIDRCRRRGAHEARSELLAVGAVVDPLTRGGDPFASGDRRRMPDHGDKIAVATSFDTKNAKTAFLW